MKRTHSGRPIDCKVVLRSGCMERKWRNYILEPETEKDKRARDVKFAVIRLENSFHGYDMVASLFMPIFLRSKRSDSLVLFRNGTIEKSVPENPYFAFGTLYMTLT